MLTIRQGQVEALRQSHLQKFEDEMVEHLRKFAPRHWKVMGEADGRRVIRLGIEHAQKYGFTNRGPVRFYIELMFMFGSFFATDPQYPWATAALSSPGAADQVARADRLHAALKEYIARVIVPERDSQKAAAQKLLDPGLEKLLPAGTSLNDGILHVLQELWPAKSEYLGAPVLAQIIDRGFELADQYQFSTDKGKVLMVTLSFAVGHGFTQDPLNGWILRRLNNPQWSDPGKQVDELYSKSRIYLQHILKGGLET